MKVILWKVGSLDHHIVPSMAAIHRFREVIREMMASKEEIFNVIWDPAITVQEVEFSPEGLNVACGDVTITPALRQKLERLIGDVLGSQSVA